MGQTDDDIDSINWLLNKANTYGLENEILLEAFRVFRDDKNLTITEAIDIAFNEWVK